MKTPTFIKTLGMLANVLILSSSLSAQTLPGFLERDQDENGRLTLQESQLAPKLFHQLDSSKNGELSLGEFGEHWKTLAPPSFGNLKYAQDSPQQKLDLYLPANPSSELPLVLWIHGGSWQRGSKDFNPVSNLTKHGFAVASLDYRFVQESKFPAQLDDCRDALKFVKDKLSSEHGVKVKDVTAIGLSAGGHLSLLMSCHGLVDRAVSFGTPTNLKQSAAVEAYRKTLEALVGSPMEEHLEDLMQASPYYQVGDQSGEFLLFHGTGDRRVPTTEALNFASKVAKKRGSVALRIVPDGSHTLVGGPRAWTQILNFIKGSPQDK